MHEWGNSNMPHQKISLALLAIISAAHFKLIPDSEGCFGEHVSEYCPLTWKGRSRQINQTHSEWSSTDQIFLPWQGQFLSVRLKRNNSVNGLMRMRWCESYGLCSHQVSTQPNTYGRFWNIFRRDHPNTKWGRRKTSVHLYESPSLYHLFWVMRGILL